MDLTQLRIEDACWLLKSAGRPTRKGLGLTGKEKTSSDWQPPMRRDESRVRKSTKCFV